MEEEKEEEEKEEEEAHLDYHLLLGGVEGLGLLPLVYSRRLHRPARVQSGQQIFRTSLNKYLMVTTI